ncbi:MAG: hypothetical protein ACP5FK_11240 [bacterium]
MNSSHSIASLIYRKLDQLGKLHYRKLTDILKKEIPGIDEQRVNATCSGDQRFQSDNRGHWWIIGRTDREIELNEKILDFIKSGSKPLYTPQINYHLYVNDLLKLDEESLPRRILMGNSFVRWGTSDYWSDQNINLPTSNISNFYREQIKNFFTRYRQPLTRKSLADTITSLAGIYIRPESGFNAEISKLIKEKYLKNLGHSVIATMESSFHLTSFKLKEMLYTILQRYKYPMNLNEIKNKIAEDFNHDIPETSISSALVEDTRFVHHKNHYWTIRGFNPPQSESKNVYKSGKKINSNKISASSLKKGVLPVDPEISKIFPSYQSQVIFKTEAKTHLVNYNFENRTLENLNNIYDELEIKVGDILQIKLSDINLKVYQIQKITTQDPSYRNSPKSKLLIPGISNHDLIYNFKDIVSNFTAPDQCGKILLPLKSLDLTSDLSVLLFHGNRNISWQSKDDLSATWVKQLKNSKKSKLKISRFSRTWWRNELSFLQKKLSPFYQMDEKCLNCDHPLHFLDHIWGTLSYRVICSNNNCRNSSLRNAQKIRMDIQEQQRFNERINEQMVNFLYRKDLFNQNFEQKFIRSFISPYCLLGLDLLIKSIDKVNQKEYRTFLYLTWMELLLDCLNNDIMIDKNILINYDLKLKNLTKFLLEFKYRDFTLSSSPDFEVSYYPSSTELIKQKIIQKIVNSFSGFSEAGEQDDKNQYGLKSSGKYFLITKRNILDPDHHEITDKFRQQQLGLIKKYTAIMDNSDVLVFEKQ